MPPARPITENGAVPVSLTLDLILRLNYITATIRNRRLKIQPLRYDHSFSTFIIMAANITAKSTSVHRLYMKGISWLKLKMLES